MRGGGHLKLTEGRKTGFPGVYVHVIAHFLRDLVSTSLSFLERAKILNERSEFSILGEGVNRSFEVCSTIGQCNVTHVNITHGPLPQSLPRGREVEQHTFLKRNAAFTLAEVLITLGIIGIVAALTMPALIANYREKAFVTSAKRGYSVLTNAMNKWNADNGIVGDPTYFWLSGTDAELLTEFAKVLNAAKVCSLGKLADCGGGYDILQYKKMNDGKGNTTQENWISRGVGRIILADGTCLFAANKH